MSKAADRLRGERETVATGRLGFDRDEARHKMRMFRLPNPHFYVLQFVRAASVLGADRIEFELSARQMVCTFNRALDTKAFDNFWASVFEARTTPDERAMHNIALGIGSAQALNPLEIRVQSGRREIVFTEDGERVIDVAAAPGTRIEMTEKFRFGHLLEFFTEHAEASALRDYCKYSQMLVIVDGQSVQSVEGSHRVDFDSEDTSGWVALRRQGEHTHSIFYFHRDDVRVRTYVALPQPALRPALGAVNSRSLQTDLSGLELSSGEELMQLLYGEVYAAYHKAVLWSLKQPGRDADLMNVGMAIFEHMERSRRQAVEPPPETRELADWWLDQKLFAPADQDEEHVISARRALHEGAFVFSRRRYSGAKLSAYPHVILAHNLPLQAVMRGLRCAGYGTLDITDELTAAAEAERNRRAWESQPPREDRKYAVSRNLQAGESTGMLFAPFLATGAVERPQCEVTTYAQGRLLARRQMKLPIGVWLDGEFEPDDAYEDVRRDAAFRRLAGKAMEQVPFFVRDVLRHVTTPSVQVGQRDDVMELLLGYLNGSLFGELASAFRYPVDELVDPSLRVDLEPNRLTWLEQLGELAEFPVFTTASGDTRSLRELNNAALPPVIVPHRALMLADPAKLVANKGYDLFQVGAAEAKILRHLRPDALDQEFAASIVNEARYMEQPVFERSQVNVLERTSQRWVETEGTYRIDADLLGEGDHCVVWFVYRDRLLSHDVWPSLAGRFRVVVTCDDLTPTEDYDDVVRNALRAKIRGASDSLTRSALSSWCMSVRLEEALDPGEFRLLWNASSASAAEKPNAVAVPIWRCAEDGWERAAVSLFALNATAEEDGGVLRVHRGQELPPASAERRGMILRAPADAQVSALVGARLIEVGNPLDDDAVTHFLAQPVVSPAIPGALFTWSTEVDGVQVEIGMIANPDPTPFGHGRHVITALWKGRKLEEISDPVPFGWFRTVASGGSIAPDPDLAFVGVGRGAALRAAQVGVVRLLKEVCHQMDSRRMTALRELEPLQTELLHILASCTSYEPPPPFDLLGLLHKTSLYDTTWGERLSFNELERLEVEGVIPYVTAPSPDRALLLEPARVPLVQQTCPHRYALMRYAEVESVLSDVDKPTSMAPEDQTPLTQEVAEAARLHDDDLLDRLAKHVLAARSRWLPDSLIMGLCWGDDVRGLCDVQLDGIRLQREHPLVEICRRDPSDATPMRVLASVVGTSVNHHLRVITDAHELEFQAALIAASVEY